MGARTTGRRADLAAERTATQTATQTVDATGDYLGTGWSFPPTFERASASVVMTSDEVNIRESIWILLSTRLGERIMLALYGCDLNSMVFTSLTTTTANQMADLVAQAILNWEPRVDLVDVDVALIEPASGKLEIAIEYHIRQTNSRSNLVYPFYLTEATLLPAGPLGT